MSSLTLLSRILGFVRDLLVARLLGTSIFADAFFVAFRIPNLLRSFVAEGALTSAFTPVFATSLAQGKENAHKALSVITGFLLTATGVLTLLLIFFAEEIVAALAPGFAHNLEQFKLCVAISQIMAPYILCVSLIAMINAALNTLRIFGTSAWAQVIMNIVLIIGALVAIPFEPRPATILLSVSVLVGGVAQIVAQIPAILRAGLSIKPSFNLLSKEVREVVSLMIPATIGASVYQITIFIATVLASLLPVGSVSWLFYADRVAQFPIGIFSIALASVLLPALSNASAKGDSGNFNRNIANSLRFTSFCILPMSAGIWALALPITETLFERGAFSHDSSVKTALALQALSFGLWASSCHSMVVRAFIAKRDTVTPTLIGITSLVVNVITSLALMGPIATGAPVSGPTAMLRLLQASITSYLPVSAALGHVGLALASSVAAAVSLIVALCFFSLKIGAFPWRDFIRSSLHSAVASLVMVVAIRSSLGLPVSSGVLCAVGLAVGAATYGIVLCLCRSQELSETLSVVRAKLSRP